MNDREYIWQLQEKGVCNIHVKYTTGIGARTGLEKQTFIKKIDFLKHATEPSKPFSLVIFPAYLPLDIDFKALNEQEKVTLTEYLDAHPLFAATRQHKTKSGGRHYLFKYPVKKVTRKKQEVKKFSFECLPDHPTGFIDLPWNLAYNDIKNAMYEVTNPADPLELTDEQFDSLGLVYMKPDIIDVKSVQDVSEGTRHNTVLRIVSTLVAKGASNQQVYSFFSRIEKQFYGSGDFDLTKEVDSVLSWCRDNIKARIEEIPLFDITQRGFADRIEYYIGKGVLVYNVTSDTWHIYDKTCWRDNKFTPLEMVGEIAKNVLRDEFSIRAYTVTEDIEDEEARTKAWESVWKSYSTHFKDCQSRDYITAALAFLKDRENFSATEDSEDRGRPVFNQVNHKINFNNTAFDFTTFETCPFDWKDFSTVFCPIDYDPDAKCPTFESFIDRIMGSNKDLIKWMQMFLGSCLIGGANTDKILPVFWGSGNNGKSTLIDILHSIFGGYSTTVNAEVLAYTKNKDTFGLSELPNKRLVTAQESEANAKLDIGRVKELTGNDTQECKRKYQRPLKFRPTFKIILSTNNRPKILDNGNAVWSRVKLVPFSVEIPKAEQIPNLDRTILKNEGSGVLNWLIEGARLWSDSGKRLPENSTIEAASKDYQENEDIILQWINERCDTAVDYKNGASLSNLYEDFKRTYIRIRRGDFKEGLRKHGYEPETDTYGIVKFALALRTETGFTDTQNTESGKCLGLSIENEQYDSFGSPF